MRKWSIVMLVDNYVQLPKTSTGQTKVKAICIENRTSVSSTLFFYKAW